MISQADILSALVRLSRRPAPATWSDLVAALVLSPFDDQLLASQVAALARAGLVTRNRDTVRLSLSGLAVAMAVSPRSTTGVRVVPDTRRAAVPPSSNVEILPMPTRRHHAA